MALWHWIVGGIGAWYLLKPAAAITGGVVGSTNMTADEIDAVAQAMYTNGLPSGIIPLIRKLDTGQIVVEWKCPSGDLHDKLFSSISAAISAFGTGSICQGG